MRTCHTTMYGTQKKYVFLKTAYINVQNQCCAPMFVHSPKL